jgi:hypothetical protein
MTATTVPKGTPTPSEGTTPSNEGGGVNVVVIVVPIIVGVLVLSVVIGICWYRRRQRMDDSKFERLSESFGDILVYS